jgi:gas vesicle protein
MAGEVLHADSKPSESMVTSMAMFLGGATIGALAALLLAPHAGHESRGQLSEFGRRTGETMREWATAASDLFTTGTKLSEAAPEAAERMDAELKW